MSRPQSSHITVYFFTPAGVTAIWRRTGRWRQRFTGGRRRRSGGRSGRCRTAPPSAGHPASCSRQTSLTGWPVIATQPHASQETSITLSGYAWICDRPGVEWDWSLRVFDHVDLHAGDLAASVRFYETVLAPLGIPKLFSDGGSACFSNLNVVDRQPPTTGLHVCFHARSREAVDEFHRAGVAA